MCQRLSHSLSTLNPISWWHYVRPIAVWKVSLLETIIQAVADVDEGSLIHFKEHQPGTSNVDLSKIQHELHVMEKAISA